MATSDASAPAVGDSTGGTLYVVATPIGNLGDITHRAVEVLRSVACVLAEDTRHSRKLLDHLQITRPMQALHEHNERDRAASVVARLRDGEDLALISDAGTPLVSDPGQPLVAAAVAAGLEVVPVPGASAVLAALVKSGLPTDRFVFEGFLPRKGAARRERLGAIANQSATSVVFLAPHRAGADLRDLAESCGDERPAVACRELTKLHEAAHRGSLATLAEGSDGWKGELVLVISGRPAIDDDPISDERLRDRAVELSDDGQTNRDIVRALVAEFGIARNRAYEIVHG